MAAAVPEALLERFSRFIAERIGLHFPRQRWGDLERNTGYAAREIGFPDSEAFIRHALSSSLSTNQAEILASNLTIGETYFYREKKAFEALEQYILPELLRSRRSNGRNIRLWSAGCCTGEEPYSIAIALNKSIPDLKDWNTTILATDINPRFLKRASQAIYGEWSFREAPRWLKENYFTKAKSNHYEIKPHIKKMVTFAHLNLAEDVYPSLLNNTNAMDIIFCRNVMMYFTPEHARKTIQNLYQCLVDGGWLIVSSIETSLAPYSQFTTASFNGLTIYRKDLSSPPKAATPEVYKEFVFDTAAGDPGYIAEPEPPVYSCPEPPPLPEAEKAEKAPPPPTPYQQALALYKQGLYAEVTERLPVMLAEGQVDSGSASLLARAYANRGRLVEALEWCQKAIAGDKLNPALYYLQATILEEKDDIEAASACLKQALYLDQDFVLAHIALGNLFTRQQKPAQAGRHFNNAISLLKTYPEEAIIAESEGMTAGRLMDIINSTRYMGRSL